MTISGIIKYLKEDIWRIRLNDLPGKRLFLIKNARIVLLAYRGFDEDKCSLRASALTFFSLLSIVPVAALAFGIAKGFGMHQLLENELLKSLKGQEEVVNYIINFAGKMLDKTRGGLIAGIGVIFLIYLIIKLLSNIEEAFNEIWGASHSRSISRKLSDYLSVLFIAPILFIISSSATVFIKTQIISITKRIDLLGPLSPLILFSLKILPYCVIWLLLTFVYIFMPNTKVRFKSGLIGGIVAGTIYVLVQYVYITFQVGVARYGAIYGSFAGIPLFMIWLQMSWLIVLFGAEISFAHQNVHTYEMESESLNASNSLKRLLALGMTTICVKNFIRGENPWSADRIAEKMELPIKITNRLLDDLVQCHVLSETIGDDQKTIYYQPAVDVNILSIQYIIQKLEKLGSEDITYANSTELGNISESMNELSTLMKGSLSNRLLKDL